MSKKRGQISIFIIIAVVILAGVVGYFLLRGKISIEKIPVSFKPVEEHFLDCIEEEVGTGIGELGAKGGYIYLPEFSPGSEYMPFSNQLNFLGSPIPYWYYVSGNNIIREQVPSKIEMEKQLERYLEENLFCDFRDFTTRGFDIDLAEIKADIKILDNKVDVEIKADLDVSLEEEAYRFTSHKREVNSNIGKFYSEAIKIYNYEKQNMFLENYAVDVLRLYAPVDGVELSCSPKIWMKNNVDNELKQALEANMQAIRFGAGKGYFTQNLNMEGEVNFLYDRTWPARVEVWDSNNGVLLAEPVGNQPGLGILGFCYVPYHFVYDVVFPVLIQVYDSKEIFQFPVAVIIDKNKAREALPISSLVSEPELCKYKDSEITVYTYDNSLEPVEADIGFECLGEKCDIGKTKIEGGETSLTSLFPRCINGYISAEADNYARKRYLFSTNEEGTANIVLDKLYEMDVELQVNEKITNDNAIISFVSQDNVQTIAWPEQKKIKLSEGYYNISVFVFKESGITIPGMKKEICNDVPKSGLLGIFGAKEEKCFDVDIPSQTLANVVSGGGKAEEYIIESQLQEDKIIVKVQSLPIPRSIEDLQDTYNLLEIKPVYLEFK